MSINLQDVNEEWVMPIATGDVSAVIKRVSQSNQCLGAVTFRRHFTPTIYINTEETKQLALK